MSEHAIQRHFTILKKLFFFFPTFESFCRFANSRLVVLASACISSGQKKFTIFLGSFYTKNIKQKYISRNPRFFGAVSVVEQSFENEQMLLLDHIQLKNLQYVRSAF